MLTPQDDLPVLLVIMGATGNLMAKKIVPALQYLFRKQKLPRQIKIIGFGRRAFDSEQFREYLVTSHPDHFPKLERDFLDLFDYVQGELDASQSFENLSQALSRYEAEWQMAAERLFYFAVPPELYGPLIQQFAAAGLQQAGEQTEARFLLEKPFGYDLPSFHALEKTLEAHLRDEQIYFIDHYLAKDIIQSIIPFRFSNCLFEPVWNNHFITKIEVHCSETIGVRGRGVFYDQVGAFLDVGQNHLLEMLAAVTMERPADLTPASVRTCRADILKTLRPWTEESLRSSTRRAQHEGYRNIEGVASDSTRDTYFHITTELAHPLWAGVPIILEGGKSLKEVRKEIVVHFSGHETTNKIIFSLAPEERISIAVTTKKAGFESDLDEHLLEYALHDKQDRSQYVQEYAALLLAAMHGDQSFFVSREEIEAMWTFADPITAAWGQSSVPLEKYAPNEG